MTDLLNDYLWAVQHGIQREHRTCPAAHRASDTQLADLERRDVAEQIARCEDEAERVRLARAWAKVYAP